MSKSPPTKPAQKEPPAPEPTPPEVRSSAPFVICNSSFKASSPRRDRVRPATYTEELADDIYEAVLLYGHSDTGAAARFGVSASVIARWKRENEDFAADLKAARAEFKEQIMAKIRNATKRDGSLDWRARAWLLERQFPDEFGRPNPKAKPPKPEPEFTSWIEAIKQPPGTVVLTPALMKDLQRVHKAECMVMYAVEDRYCEARAQALFEEWKHARNSPQPSPPIYPKPPTPICPPPPRPPANPTPSAATPSAPVAPSAAAAPPSFPDPKSSFLNSKELESRKRMLADFIAAEGDEEEP